VFTTVIHSYFYFVVYIQLACRTLKIKKKKYVEVVTEVL